MLNLFLTFYWRKFTAFKTFFKWKLHFLNMQKFNLFFVFKSLQKILALIHLCPLAVRVLCIKLQQSHVRVSCQLQPSHVAQLFAKWVSRSWLRRFARRDDKVKCCGVCEKAQSGYCFTCWCARSVWSPWLWRIRFYKAIEHSWALTTTFATISPKICRVVANFLTLPMKRDLTNGMRFRCLKCFKEDSV